MLLVRKWNFVLVLISGGSTFKQDVLKMSKSNLWSVFPQILRAGRHGFRSIVKGSITVGNFTQRTNKVTTFTTLVATEIKPSNAGHSTTMDLSPYPSLTSDLSTGLTMLSLFSYEQQPKYIFTFFYFW